MGNGRSDLGGISAEALSLGMSILVHGEIVSVLCPQHAVY